ncbi:MAG: RNA polymerase sigma factor [Terriglobia bacterium]
MAARDPQLKAPQVEAEERLLVEAAQRDPAKFGELYEINFERVYAFIARRVPNRDEAQDLTADVFHRALANLQRFEWRGAPFAAWLFRIAANAITDRAKRNSKERALADLDVPADSDLDEVEHRAQLFRLVNQLPQDQRRVLTMRFAEQKSVREIARELARTEGAVKQLQFRALEKLRARLSGREEGVHE